MTARRLALIAALGSAALLAGAFFFQALGYAPCKMCLWQRWPHGAAIAFGLLAFVGGPLALWALGGAVSALTTSGIGVYHSGVERGWWEGPTSCTGDGGGLSGLSGADLLSTENAAPVVMCDEVSWWFLGLTMANYNAIFSVGLAAIWIAAFARARARVS